MGTATAEASDAGKQDIRKRLTACIDYLQNLQDEYNKTTDETEKERLKQQIQGAIDRIKEGGSNCPDRAIVFLTDLENYIKLLKNPEYLPNVMIHLFKFAIIQSTLIDPVLANNAENVETFLKYCLEMSPILGLDVDQAMLYEAIAQAIPLKEALPKLSKAFNEEALLDFTANQSTFRSMVEKDKESWQPLVDLREEYSDAFYTAEEAEEENAPNAKDLRAKAQALADQLPIMEEKFYKARARELFIQAGFINAE